jgi:hypothetical protein
MKLIAFFLVFHVFNVFCITHKTNERAFSIAFEEIINRFSKHNNEVTVINFSENKFLFDKVLLENFKRRNVPQKIINIDKDIPKTVDAGNFAILLLDSVESLTQFNKKVKMADANAKSMKMFVYFRKATVGELLKSFKGISIRDNTINQYFMMDDGKSIKLMTVEWFRKKSCGWTLVEINRFERKEKKWKNSMFWREKFRNFHGCHLVMGVFDLYHGYSENSTNGENFGKQVMEALNESLKFDLRYSIKKLSGSGNKMETLYSDGMPDFSPNFIIHQTVYSKDNIHLHLTDVAYFAVPPGVPYDSYQKFYLPYDLHTWILTLMTFAVAFLTILIVYRMNNEVQNFVFGENVATPSLNVLAHFVGMSQTVMPKRNFARFLVMMFTLLSFMIRTLYQGFMCDNFQTDLRGPEPIQSVRDIVKTGYAFHHSEGYDERMNLFVET